MVGSCCRTGIEPVRLLGSRSARRRLVRLAEEHGRLVELVSRELGGEATVRPVVRVVRAAQRVAVARELMMHVARAATSFEELASTLLKLLHLSYLATGFKQVRYAASVLYAAVLASRLEQERLRGILPSLLDALRTLLRGDYEAALAAAGRLVGYLLLVKPRFPESPSAWAAALELSYLLEVASEVDGSLLEAWGYCRAMEE